MANKFKVTDSEFNRANYPDIIGEVFDTPPAYANVEMVRDITSMDSIFETQSKWSRDEVSDEDIIGFIIKSLRAGHQQVDIIKSVMKYFRKESNDAQGLFTKAVVKMKNIKPPKDTKDIKYNKDVVSDSKPSWYKEAQEKESDNRYYVPVTPEIYFNDDGTGNRDFIASPVNIPFYIDIDARGWGIKGISVYASDTIVVEYNLIIWGDDGDQESENNIVVDLSKIPTDDSSNGHGTYTVTGLDLHLGANDEVDYSRSLISFSKG